VRAGVWFNALPRIDRVLIDLTITVASSVRSNTLARSVFAVVEKLENLLESSLLRARRVIGVPLAQKLGALAQRWGNISAKDWSSDSSFINYLAVSSINEPKTFKT
jgi:hypothetical protein